MGTRGILGFRCDQKDFLTYNHYDSYPEVLGANVLKAYNEMFAVYGTIDAIKQKVLEIKFAKDKSISDIINKASDLNLNLNIHDTTIYEVLNPIQGELFSYLKLGYMTDDHKFIRNSLFCEFAYIVNLDSEKLEFYKGFQKEKHNEGRYSDKKRIDEEYYPCALKLKIPLVDIIGMEEKAFVDKCINSYEDINSS